MPKYIIKLETRNGPRYLEWSTVVDSPITAGMPLELFTQYYQEEYGRRAMHELKDRLARVEVKGTSDMFADDLEDTIIPNRAGKGETHLTLEQLIDFFCDRQCEGPEPEGKTWQEAFPEDYAHELGGES